MKYRNLLMYIGIVLIILALIIFIPDLNDMVEMMLFASIIVITSIYTYGTRRKK